MKLDETTSIVKAITRLTVSLSYKFQLGTAHDRAILSSAITILTQAMIASQENPSEAQKLYTAALKLSALTGKNQP